MARTRRRRSYRKSKRWNPGCMNPRRRNPSGTELKDGTIVSASGDSVTLLSPYGENYDYDGVTASSFARLRRAKSFKQACSVLDKHCVLRSINPRGRRRYGSTQARNLDKYIRSAKRGAHLFAKGRRNRHKRTAAKWYGKYHALQWQSNPGKAKARKKGRRKLHPATRKGRHHASRLRSEWKRRTRYGGRYSHLGAVVRTDKHGRIHAGRKKHVKGHSWTGRKGTVALYDRRSGKLWGTNPRSDIRWIMSKLKRPCQGESEFFGMAEEYEELHGHPELAARVHRWLKAAERAGIHD